MLSQYPETILTELSISNQSVRYLAADTKEKGKVTHAD